MEIPESFDDHLRPRGLRCKRIKHVTTFIYKNKVTFLLEIMSVMFALFAQYLPSVFHA